MASGAAGPCSAFASGNNDRRRHPPLRARRRRGGRLSWCHTYIRVQAGEVVSAFPCTVPNVQGLGIADSLILA